MSLRWLSGMSNPQEAKEVLDKANSIRSRAEVILRTDYYNWYNIDRVSWEYNEALNRDEIIVIGSDSSGDRYYESFPMDWLFLDDVGLEKAKVAEGKRKRLEAEALNEKLRAESDKIAEERDRAEYERLKAKFEGEG